MNHSDFNPQSTDAMFAKIMARLESQDRVLFEIREQTMKTNGRVTDLEREKWKQRGFVAAIGLIFTGAWELLVGHFHK